ncbi:hypothetical protein RFI_03043 [Reticulomyxa filosa]|uniref:Uncharacterized protein n=1 Tax=Reticulomyxa filosa TaxID=46433 RepID=X6P8S5_RETFI|nr:hypothetical protein RFI_03043 [Reticulomyxa filosa]|eukprot:ETO34052.1 hypothetical protein RFI_03043 [Reticulomyxa filosa]
MSLDFQHTTHHLVNQEDPVEEELEDELSATSDPKPFKLFFKCLIQPWAKYCIISTWVLVLVLGLFFAPLLLQQTQLTINSPESSDSYIAKGKMEKSFKILVGSNYVLLFSQCISSSCLNGSATIYNATGDGKCNYKCLQEKLYGKYKQYSQDHHGQFYNFTDYYTSLSVKLFCANVKKKKYTFLKKSPFFFFCKLNVYTS